jgi:hypothetical protein
VSDDFRILDNLKKIGNASNTGKRTEPETHFYEGGK